MAFNLHVVAALLLSAIVLGQAADFCPSGGAYHLSCYKATVSAATAKAAKQQCFTAWNKPDCPVTVVDNAPANDGSCPTPVLYRFTTAACRDAYQAQEKTNAGCTQYNAAKLGDAANRATANTPADYVCPGRRLF